MWESDNNVSRFHVINFYDQIYAQMEKCGSQVVTALPLGELRCASTPLGEQFVMNLGMTVMQK